MRGELLAEKGEVVLFKGGGSESSIGIEKTIELSDDIFALVTCEQFVWCMYDLEAVNVPFLGSLATLLLCSFLSHSVFVVCWMPSRIANMYEIRTPSTYYVN